MEGVPLIFALTHRLQSTQFSLEKLALSAHCSLLHGFATAIQRASPAATTRLHLDMIDGDLRGTKTSIPASGKHISRRAGDDPF
jgi:hypothetical protein